MVVNSGRSSLQCRARRWQRPGQPREAVAFIRNSRARGDVSPAKRTVFLSEATLVPCSRCGALNRIPTAKLGSGPACGKCKAPLFTGQPIAVAQAQFDRLAGKGDLPILADFWAEWCGPCKAMAPAFSAAARTLEPKMRLVKVDTEREQALAARYAIRSIPTLMVLTGGREIARTAGAMSEAALVDWARRVASSI